MHCSAVYTATAETDRYPNNMHRACLEHALLLMCCECARETHTVTERHGRACLGVCARVYVYSCLFMCRIVCVFVCVRALVLCMCVYTHIRSYFMHRSTVCWEEGRGDTVTTDPSPLYLSFCAPPPPHRPRTDPFPPGANISSRCCRPITSIYTAG